jgi:hypothetical protein
MEMKEKLAAIKKMRGKELTYHFNYQNGDLTHLRSCFYIIKILDKVTGTLINFSSELFSLH